jgi:lysophospholipid acyltransferase (LPLAT)-like uncharacterized protein
VPYPFTRGVFICGEPIYVDREMDAAGMEAARAGLEQTLNELTARADNFFSKG